MPVLLSETLPNLTLIALGLYLAFISLKGMFFPTHTGIIVKPPEISAPSGDTGGACLDRAKCRMLPGRSGVPILVKTPEGTIIEAEISPCSICIEALKVGDTVGLTRAGERVIAQRALRW